MTGPRVFKRYGFSVSRLHPQIQDIWYSRNEELPPTPSFGMACDYMTDERTQELIEEGAALWRLAKDMLPKRDFLVLEMMHLKSMDLHEVADVLGVTSERVRQIDIKSRARLRKCALAGKQLSRFAGVVGDVFLKTKVTDQERKHMLKVSPC